MNMFLQHVYGIYNVAPVIFDTTRCQFHPAWGTSDFSCQDSQLRAFRNGSNSSCGRRRTLCTARMIGRRRAGDAPPAAASRAGGREHGTSRLWEFFRPCVPSLIVCERSCRAPAWLPALG